LADEKEGREGHVGHVVELTIRPRLASWVQREARAALPALEPVTVGRTIGVTAKNPILIVPDPPRPAKPKDDASKTTLLIPTVPVDVIDIWSEAEIVIDPFVPGVSPDVPPLFISTPLLESVTRAIPLPPLALPYMLIEEVPTVPEAVSVMVVACSPIPPPVVGVDVSVSPIPPADVSPIPPDVVSWKRMPLVPVVELTANGPAWVRAPGVTVSPAPVNEA
jgi:hypothetical protein